MSTVKQAISEGHRLLASSESAKLDAEVLLSFVLNKDRAYLYTWPDLDLSSQQSDQYLKFIHRRRKGEPVAYITGTKEFWGMPFKVTPDTLIPRPETERLVEIALDKIASLSAANVLDLGTGSGAIAIAIAKECPQLNVTATDTSLTALDIAKSNAQSNQVDNVHFMQSDWYSNLSDQRFDVILSNPPYVRENDPHLQTPDLTYEPIQALVSGRDGLQDIREIVLGTNMHLNSQGWLILEHGYDQGDTVKKLLEDQGLTTIHCYQDYGARERATLGRKR